jgi:chromosome partitioning protein
MVQVIAVVGRKGGIGKTTLSVHLAGELAARGRRIHLVDADPQGSAAQWAAPGNLRLPVKHLPVTVENLKPWVGQVRKLAAEILILDCPPHLDAALGAALGLADLALLPCGPSGLDMMAMGEVLAVVRQARAHRAGKPAALIIPNRGARSWTNSASSANPWAQRWRTGRPSCGRSTPAIRWVPSRPARWPTAR